MPPKNTQSPPKDPHVANSVKVTYLQRSRNISKEPSTDDLNATPSSSASVFRKPTSNIKSKTDALFKTPENPHIRIVDFRTETSPKRLQNERSKSSASIVLLDQASKDTKSIPSGVSPDGKPQSSTNRSQTPISEVNPDNVSIADSVADSISISGNRIKRSEGERKQYFENQPECGPVEVHQAFCTRCKEWVRLSSRQTYYVKPWEVHRARCDQKLPAGHTYKDLGLVASVPFVVPRTEKIRKVLLELDDSAETVEPERVKCKRCEQWVPLEKKYSVRTWSRHKGACRDNLKPSDIEQTLERKLFFLCDALFKKFRDKHTVECRGCDEAISLKPGQDYDLDFWLEHKKICHFRSPEAKVRQLSASGGPSSAKVEQEMLPRSNVNSTTNSAQSDRHTVESAAAVTNSDARASQSAGPSQSTTSVVPSGSAALSTTDSERTLIPPPSSTSLQSVSSQAAPESIASGSRKRPRGSNEDGDGDEGQEGEGDRDEGVAGDGDGDGERAARRPRLASYMPEQTDDSTGLGLFLLPFQAFVNGFKASLTSWDP